jgi:hypothetical protein
MTQNRGRRAARHEYSSRRTLFGQHSLLSLQLSLNSALDKAHSNFVFTATLKGRLQLSLPAPFYTQIMPYLVSIRLSLPRRDN